MQDISLHLLDIIENSARANATNIWIDIKVEIMKNRLTINVQDDGDGMDEETLEKAQSPFYTSKSARKKKVGLGIPLFKQHAQMCDGDFVMISKPNVGTKLTAFFRFDHVDRMPLGDINTTIVSSILGHPEMDFHIILSRKMIDGKEFTFELSTTEIKAELGDIPLSYPDVINYLNETIKEGINKTKMEEI